MAKNPLNKKQVEETKKAVKGLNDAISTLADSVKGVTSEFSKINFSKSVKKSSRETEKLNDKLIDTKRTIEDMQGSLKKLGAEKGADPKWVKEYNGKLSDMKFRISEVKKASRAGLINEDQVEAEIKKIEEMSTELKTLENDIGNLKQPTMSTFGAMGEGAEAFMGTFRALRGSPKQLKDQADKAGLVAKKMKDIGGKVGNFKKFNVVLASTGKLLKGLGGALGGITKLMGGWVGIIAMVAKKIIDLGVKADTFQKNANKAFARVRGPDIMTDDVKKQFKEFNDQIYNMGENLRVGVNVDEIRALMESLHDTGIAITRLNKGLLTYRDVVNVAAKGSRALGLDLVQVGSMIGDLMANFRMNINEIDDAFIQVAFDAKKAGLSSDVFWSAVKNASASMSLYGVFIKSASKAMEEFTKTGAMGAQETADTVQELTGAFKNMSTEQRAALVGLIKNTKGATSTVQDMFKDLGKDYAKKAEDLKSDINITMKRVEKAEKEGTEDEVRNLKDRLTDLQTEQNRILTLSANAEQASAKSAVGMAPYLPMLADKAPELLTKLVSRFGGFSKLQGENLVTVEKIFGTLGLNTDLVMKMKNMSMSMERDIKNTLGFNKEATEYEQSFVKLLEKQNDITKDQRNKLAEKFDDLGGKVDAGPAEQRKAIDSMAKDLTSELGWPKEASKNLAEIAVLDKAVATRMSEMIKSGEKLSEKQIENFKEFIGARKMGDKQLGKANQAQTVIQSEMEKNAEETMDAVVKQTLSLEDMKKIAKDDIQYRLYANKFMQGMTSKMGDVIGLLAKDKHYKTNQMKVAEESLKLQGINVSWNKKTGYHTNQMQSEMKKSVAAIKAAKEEQLTQKGINAALSDVESLEDLKAKLDEQTKKTKETLEEKGEKSTEYKAMLGTKEKLEELVKKYSKKEAVDKEQFKEEIEQEKADAQDQIKEQEEIISKNKKILKQLQTLDRGNSKIVKTLMTLAMGNEESRKELGKNLGTLIEKEEDIPGILSDYGLGGKTGQVQALEAMKTAGASDKDIEMMENYIQDLKAQERVEEANVGAGFQEGGFVKKPIISAVAEKEPEAIIPISKMPDIISKSLNNMVDTTPAPAGGGNRQDISIQVNANTKDLAQTIADNVERRMRIFQTTGA